MFTLKDLYGKFLEESSERLGLIEKYRENPEWKDLVEEWLSLEREAASAVQKAESELSLLERLWETFFSPELSPSELFLELIRAFLRGPVADVFGAVEILVERDFLLKKARGGAVLSARECACILRGADSQEGSALYAISYRFQYEFFSSFTGDEGVKAPDGLLLYPPDQELIRVGTEMDALYESPSLKALRDALAEASEPDADEELRRKVSRETAENSELEKLTELNVELIKVVLGPAATGFLKVALKSIPEVEGYFEKVMPPEQPAWTSSEWVLDLLHAPAYLRVVVYVADANDPGHSLTGTKLPFSEKTSQTMKEWIDEMTRELFDDRASENPFSSAQRERFYKENPLDVDQMRRAETSASAD